MSDHSVFKEATLKFGTPDFHVLKMGDYVRCAISGQLVRIDELKYWSVEKQEPYTHDPNVLLQLIMPR